jgi:hypothetical protein
VTGVSAPTQKDLENCILLMLAEEARASDRPLTVNEIVRKLIPPVGATQVQIGLTHLERLGLASGNFDNPRSLGFLITRKGMIEVESQFDRTDYNADSSYRAKVQPSGPEPSELGELVETASDTPRPLSLNVDSTSPSASTSPIFVSSKGVLDYARPPGQDRYETEISSSVNDSLQNQASASPTLNVHLPTIDSSSWTGKQFVLVDANVIAEVLKSAQQLHAAVYALHLPSNSETEDLQKLAEALLSVCSMTEPEVSIIDRILASPKFKAYVGLFTIIATIRGAMGI